MENEDDKFSEHGLTTDDEEVVFNTKHTIDRLDYDDMGHFVTDTDYRHKDEGEETAEMKRAAVWMVEDEITWLFNFSPCNRYSVFILLFCWNVITLEKKKSQHFFPVCIKFTIIESLIMGMKRIKMYSWGRGGFGVGLN